MGNSGDITPVMLYRALNGNIDFDRGQQPKVAVLLCGTNNFVVKASAGGKVQWGLGVDCPPEDVAAGARAVAQVFRRKLPQTRVIMLGILPVANERIMKAIGVKDPPGSQKTSRRRWHKIPRIWRSSISGPPTWFRQANPRPS
ncbi:MAG: hypothetical protein ACJAVK_000264 [Akkermansiaceae bacterium]|jgi:hypothetical protein